LPNSSKIPETLAYIERRRGQLEASEAHFLEAERLDPRATFIFTQHSISYINLRRFREARQKLDQIADAVQPDEFDVATLKAVTYQAEGDLANAAAILDALHPPPNVFFPLETQLYQAILERRRAPIVSTVEQILANGDPKLGIFNGDLGFWLGWVQQVTGDPSAAQTSWQQARSDLEHLLGEQPQSVGAIALLALTNASLHDQATADDLVQRGLSLDTVKRDAFLRPFFHYEIQARVAAQTARPDVATAALETALSVPYSGALYWRRPLTPALLRLDPMFDPLRNDKRFQKLCEEPNK
jgi:tetratricopeptide (TPR) repeat protein